MMVSNKHYLNKWLTGPEEKRFQVLADHTLLEVPTIEARRSTAVLVTFAKTAQTVVTVSNNRIEAETVAEPGCAIFTDIENGDDKYVPRTANGQCWKASDLEKHGYSIGGPSRGSQDVYFKEENAAFIVDLIDRNTAIEDCFGHGAHQYLYEGDVLKIDIEGRVTGLNRRSFERNWIVSSDSIGNA